MEQKTRLYPIGIQTFSEIRNKSYLYIDKTEYVYRMTHSASKYMFLSRPRRFGKSLLTSTLAAYFEGCKDLFKGLALERLETEWTEYPVLRFDMSLGKHMDREELERYLLWQLKGMERNFGIKSETPDTNTHVLQTLSASPTSRRAAKWWCLSMNTTRPCSMWCTKKRTCPSCVTSCVISIVRSKPATPTFASSS